MAKKSEKTIGIKPNTFPEPDCYILTKAIVVDEGSTETREVMVLVKDDSWCW